MYFCFVFILCTMLWQYVSKYVMPIKQYELNRVRERVCVCECVCVCVCVCECECECECVCVCVCV